MPEITFLRFCPSCGKRFHVRVVGKELVGQEIQEGQTVEFHGGRGLGGSVKRVVAGQSGVSIVAPGVKVSPAVVDTETYRYEYKCDHCGHEWAETKVLTDEVAGGEDSGYTGD